MVNFSRTDRYRGSRRPRRGKDFLGVSVDLHVTPDLEDLPLGSDQDRVRIMPWNVLPYIDFSPQAPYASSIR